MRTLKTCIVLMVSLILMNLSRAQGQNRFGITLPEGKLQNFNIAVGNAYSHDIPWIRAQGISEEEIPMVIFLAQYSGWEPRAIVRLRAEGLRWEDISRRCGMDLDRYGFVVGQPRGRSLLRGDLGNPHWRNHGYSDREIPGAVRGHYRPDHPVREPYANSTHSQTRDGGRYHGKR